MSVSLSTDQVTLLATIEQMATASPSLDLLQRDIVESLAQYRNAYSWTGFYMRDPVDSETLVLGPFVGAPTLHARIPITQGICGAAVVSGSTVIVDDVAADPRYLSCSIETRSEIVAPIYANASVVGEIDIDSHDPAAFTQADQLFLEAVARIVGNYIEQHPIIR